MDHGSLKLALRTVVAGVNPEELDLFDVEADALINEKLTGRHLPKRNLADVQPRFGIDLASLPMNEIDSYIKIIGATISTLQGLGWLKSAKEASRRVSMPDVLKLREAWLVELRAEGISEEKALGIATRFSDDLLMSVADR